MLTPLLNIIISTKYLVTTRNVISRIYEASYLSLESIVRVLYDFFDIFRGMNYVWSIDTCRLTVLMIHNTLYFLYKKTVAQ